MGTGHLSSKYVKKRHREKHKDMGLCPYCSRKAVEGKVHCQYHLDKLKEYNNRTKIRKQRLDSLLA